MSLANHLFSVNLLPVDVYVRLTNVHLPPRVNPFVPGDYILVPVGDSPPCEAVARHFIVVVNCSLHLGMAVLLLLMSRFSTSASLTMVEKPGYGCDDTCFEVIEFKKGIITTK